MGGINEQLFHGSPNTTLAYHTRSDRTVSYQGNMGQWWARSDIAIDDGQEIETLFRNRSVYFDTTDFAVSARRPMPIDNC